MSNNLNISLGNDAARRKASLLNLAESLGYKRRRGDGFSISAMIMELADMADDCPEFVDAFSTAKDTFWMECK